MDYIMYYLSEGDPARIKQLSATSEKLIYDYYYLRRVSDLNKLLDHISYIKYLQEKNDN